MTLDLRPSQHAVTFYDDDDQLANDAASFVIDGAVRLETTIVIATAQHRYAIESRMYEAALDVSKLEARDAYIPLDAREVLTKIISRGVVSRRLFRDIAEDLLRRASARGKPIRLFGEAVSLLWDDGNVAAAMGLESLWNEVEHEYDFVLLCGYPIRSILGGELSDVDKICGAHSELYAPLSYSADEIVHVDATDELSRLFVPVPKAVTAARAFVGEAFDAWGEDDRLDDALVVVSELATDAVTQAKSAFRVTIARETSKFRLVVEDISSAPATGRLSVGSIGGLAGRLLDELTSRFGTEFLSRGKAVWCEFDR